MAGIFQLYALVIFGNLDVIDKSTIKYEKHKLKNKPVLGKNIKKVTLNMLWTSVSKEK